MDCKKAERLLLRSFDGRLNAEEKGELQDHIGRCSFCQKQEKDYRMILGLLKPGATPEPLPYFKERLLAKLKEKERALPAFLWLRWAHRAVALSLAALILFGAGVILFQPQEPQELSQVEALLLRDENPLGQAATVLGQKKSEDKNMMLIFAAAEDFSRR
jgi:anti-sigma factor RsiW